MSLFSFGTEVNATQTKTVVKSGSIPCVNDTDNVMWTLYNDGALVFSGAGTIDSSQFPVISYLQNWNTYWENAGLDKGEVVSINVEENDTIHLDTCKYMFNDFDYCTSIDMTGFDTSKVKSMYAMFSGCTILKNLDLSTFDTSSAQSMAYMFNGCNALKTLDVGKFVTSNVTSMYAMFYGCAATSLDVKKFDTKNVTDMHSMFAYCGNLTSIDISDFETNKVTDMTWMFYHCDKLETLDISSLEMSNVTDMNAMFAWCESLEKLVLTGIDTSKVTDMHYLFAGCDALTSLDVSELDTVSVTNMSKMFCNSEGLASLDLSSFDMSNVTDMSSMFEMCENLKIVKWGENLDTSKVTDMSNMFEWCYALTDLDMTGFKTDSVTNMAGMFNGCRALQTLDLSSFNTEKVRNMSNMFYGCKTLTSLDFSNFDTSKVLTFTYFADNCSGIDVMDYSSVDTSSATSPMKLKYTDELITPKTTTTFLFEGDSIWYDEAGNKYYGGEEKEIAPLTKLTRVNKYNGVYYVYEGEKEYLTEYEMELGLAEIPALSAEDLKDLGLDGYTFLGWYEDEDLTTPVTSFAANVPGDNIVYPKIAGKTYTITYKNVKQASNKEVLPANYSYGTAVTLPQLESTCYTFVGWYLDEDMTKAISTITDTTDGNLTLYARWIQNPAHEIVENNKKEPTCTELGYTGDFYCNTCQKMIIIGENIPKCSHDNSVVKNAVEATCTTDGHTGDKHCKWCDVLVEQGETIAKKGHDIDKTQGTITLEPTTVTEGTMEYPCKNCDYKEIEAIPKVGADFIAEEGIPEETVAVTDETILGMKDDGDVAGSSFVMIQARADKNTKNSVRLKWSKVKNADGYKIYGNKCGKKNRMKLLKTIENGKTTTFTQKKLKKGTYYKYIVRAYKLIDGKQVTIAVSKTIHSITKGGKYGVAKAVKIKTDKKMKSKKGSYTLTIKKNKKYTIKASEVKESKKIKQHRKVLYESSDKAIATVSKKGVVKGIKKGTCYIYAYAQNGVYKKIKVKVQ